MRTTADVVIVGGGCMGCSLAWHLTQRGLTNVVLVEREAQLATGSTGPWPATNTKSPSTIPCEYDAIGGGAFSVRTTRFGAGAQPTAHSSTARERRLMLILS